MSATKDTNGQKLKRPKSDKLLYGVCHECLRRFCLKSEYLIFDPDIEIWECPNCFYPNSWDDLGDIN